MKRSTLLLLMVMFVALNIFPWTLKRLRRGTAIGAVGRNSIRSHVAVMAPPFDSARPQPTSVAPPFRDRSSSSSIAALRVVSREATLQSLAQLISASNYSYNRAGKACERLNATTKVDLSDPFLLGVSKEVLGRNVSAEPRRVPYAYVLMVSNHKYIDGAMVVADSLKEFSDLVRKGQCDLVLIVPEKIHTSVLELLSFVFHRVKIVRSLDVLAEKSYYKTTFDKIYLYLLTEYQTVVLFDADSLMVGNPDKLFQKVSTVHPLTAVGGADYFQTALLIVKPSVHIFLDLYLEYRYGSFGYNQWRARDGILFRNCLMQMHENMGHPTNSVFHFYGYVKPWFNHQIPYKHSRGEKLEFDIHYKTWWERYERLHRTYFVPLALRDAELGPATTGYRYGETALDKKKSKGFLPLGIGSFEDAARVSPLEYMWVQRFSGGSEYLRPTFAKAAAVRGLPELREAASGAMVQIVVGPSGGSKRLSCDEVCAAANGGMRCSPSFLSHSALNDCTFSRPSVLGTVPCSTCVTNFDSAAAPFVRGNWVDDPRALGAAKTKVQGRSECFYNFLHEPMAMPQCNATPPSGARRVCPCTSR